MIFNGNKTFSPRSKLIFNQLSVDSKDATNEGSEKMPNRKNLSKKDRAKFFNIFVLTSYIIADLKKKPKSYKIGVFTVTLTVSFIILLYSILDVLPLVFLKQAQNTVGEADFVFNSVSPQNISQSADTYIYNNVYQANRIVPSDNALPFINYQEFLTQVSGNSDFEGFVPRWYGIASFANVDNLSVTAQGLIMILDSEKEVKIGLGRDFTKEILNRGQAFMTRSALRYLDVNPNGRDQVQLIVDLREYFAIFFGTNRNLTREDLSTLNTELGLGLDENGNVTTSAEDFFNVTEASGRRTFDNFTFLVRTTNVKIKAFVCNYRISKT
jgi:hypothetical protein